MRVKSTCAAPERGRGAIRESCDFEAKAVCFECSPEMNFKSREGWPYKWLFTGGLSKAFALGIGHGAVRVCSFQCDFIVLRGPSLGTRVPWNTVWEVFTLHLAEGR